MENPTHTKMSKADSFCKNNYMISENIAEYFTDHWLLKKLGYLKMARLKRRSHLATIREINMTPLIDLTFLLLIVFMITVPLMEYGVNVSPPALNATPLPEENSIYVNLNNNGQIILSKEILGPKELTLRLESLLKSKGKSTVLLRADGSRPYSEVMNTIKAVKAAGVKEISLVTQSESSK